MKTKKFSVTGYTGIGECPRVILLDREEGKFPHQFDTAYEVRKFLNSRRVYFVADKNDKQIEGLHTWGHNNDCTVRKDVFFEALAKFEDQPLQQGSLYDALQGMSDEDIVQMFWDNFDCYVGQKDELETPAIGLDVPAMTKERFLFVLNNLRNSGSKK